MRRAAHSIRSARTRRGFTLIEAAVVTVIVGVGIMAVMELLAAGSMASAKSNELVTAVNLANNIAERMQGATYSTLMATFDNQTYDPPIDSGGNTLSGFNGWVQTIDVHYVDPNRLTLEVPDSQVEVTARVTVTVKHNGAAIYTTRWMAAAPQ